MFSIDFPLISRIYNLEYTSSIFLNYLSRVIEYFLYSSKVFRWNEDCLNYSIFYCVLLRWERTLGESFLFTKLFELRRNDYERRFICGKFFFWGGRRNVLTDFLFFVTHCLLEFQVITENTRWTACENRVGRD